MARESATTRGAAVRGSRGWIDALVEVAAILGLFAAAGAWPVPDVNETAYLTKARHAFDPAWCRGDFFLETPDAHGVFYLLLGPLAASLPLERAAWIGRWLGWLAVAVGFRQAVVPLLPGTRQRVLAAAFFSLALRHTTAAGEWVIGGCEAKVFSWALLLAAVGGIGLARPARSWLLLGAATAMHPIVGGWGVVAFVASLAASWRAGLPSGRGAGKPFEMAAAVAGGIALAAAGILPALGLSAGADAATRAAAAKIHVVERLPHHLLPRTFAEGMLARHLLATLLWWLVARVRGDVPAAAAAAWSRVERFIAAAVGVSILGHVIAACEPLAPQPVYGLLRFYWFRLADVLVPFGLATAGAAAVFDDGLLRRLLPLRPAVVRAVVAALLAADIAHESRHWPLPGRPGPAARSDSKVDAAAWRDVCGWVAAHTPAEACFLTPRGSASFTWWTGRREVVGWKNSPQDAGSLVEWRRRFADCFSRDGSFSTLERSTAALGPERLRTVAETYGATHAIVPRDLPSAADLPFEKLHANRGYVVYRLVPESATEGTGSAGLPEAATP